MSVLQLIISKRNCDSINRIQGLNNSLVEQSKCNIVIRSSNYLTKDDKSRTPWMFYAKARK